MVGERKPLSFCHWDNTNNVLTADILSVFLFGQLFNMHIYTHIFRLGQLEKVYHQIHVNMPQWNGVLPAQLAAAAVSSWGVKIRKLRMCNEHLSWND